MSMIEVRLLELAIKGDRLDEINAEEALAAQARWQGRWQRLRSWLRRPARRPGSNQHPYTTSRINPARR